MSIKISGSDNTITKISGSSVYVEQNLYVNKQLVDPNGQSEAKGMTIYVNGWYTIDADIDYIKIDVTSNYDYESGTKEEGVRYYEVTENTTLVYNDFKDYGGVYVKVPAPESNPTTFTIDKCGNYPSSDYSHYTYVKINILNANWDLIKPEEGYQTFTSNATYEVSMLSSTDGICVTSSRTEESYEQTISNTNIGLSSSSSTLQAFTNSFKIKAPYSYIDDYDITWTAGIELKGKLCPNGVSDITQFENIDYYTFTFSNEQTKTSIVLTSRTYNFSMNGEAKFTSENNDTAILSINFTPKSSQDYEWRGSGTCTFKITFTPKVTQSASVLTLRSLPIANSATSSMENLVVNQDALIQGNLNVQGYINDLRWYWEEQSIVQNHINVGVGFFAQLVDCTLIISEEEVNVPLIQLSPGAQYKTENYTVVWSPLGILEFISTKDIDTITGTFKILRYE